MQNWSEYLEPLLQRKRCSTDKQHEACQQNAQGTGTAVPMTKVVRQNLVGYGCGINAHKKQANQPHPADTHTQNYRNRGGLCQGGPRRAIGHVVNR